MYSTYLRWIGRYLTPNQITIIRALFIIPAVFLWFSGDLVKECSAIFIMVLSWYGDHLDGAVARECDLESNTGKWLDPLMDKIVFYSTIIIFLYQANKIALLTILILDVISTFVRSNNEGLVEGANWYGKYKLATQVTACFVFAMVHILGNNSLVTVANNIIIVSIGLAIISVCLRIKTYRWLPNIISTGNGLCGVISMHYSYYGDFAMAINLIFFGMFLDLLDGPVARKLKVESKIGVFFDDVADGMTFGIAVGFLILTYLNFSTIGYIFAILYTTSVVVRLLDYTKTKNNAELSAPYGYFRGLPSPAGATMICVFVLFEVNQYLLIFIATLASTFMVSFKWHWIHFNQVFPKIFSKNPIIIAIVVVLAITIQYKIFLLICLTVYTASPVLKKLKR